MKLKTLLRSFAALFCASASFAICDPNAAPTYTTNAGISKPAINSCNWGITTNNNWDIVDSSFIYKNSAGGVTISSATITSLITSTMTLRSSIVSSDGSRLMYPTAFSGNQPSSIYLGYQAGMLDPPGGGAYNTGVGYRALSSIATGSNSNTAIGGIAMSASTLTYSNTAIGYQTMGIVVGNNNTALGSNALGNIIGGVANTAIGYGAGTFGVDVQNSSSTVQGSSNVFVGAYARQASTGTPSNPIHLSNAIAIGFNAVVSSSNTMQLGGSGNSAVQVIASTITVSSETVSNYLLLPYASANQCLQTDGSGKVTSSGSSCGGGGGGSSSLQITRSGVQITSPTASINFYSGDFNLSAVGSTSTVYLSPSTTNYIRNTSSLQSSATIYVSSGTITTLNNSVLNTQNVTVGNSGSLQMNQGSSISMFNNNSSGSSTLAASGSGGTTSLQIGSGSGTPNSITLTDDVILSNSPGANALLATNGSAVIVSTTINLGASNVSGTLAAGREPAHTGDVTNSAGSLAMTAAASQPNIVTFTSSITVNNTAGLKVNGPIIASSATLGSATYATMITSNTILPGATFYQNGTQAFTNPITVLNGGTGTTTPGLVAGSNISSITGTWPNQTINAATQGGGGSSSLAVTAGTSAGFSTVTSSPTAVLLFNTAQIIVASQGGATAYITLDPSTVTLQGNNLGATYLTNSSATATYLQLSSAAASYIHNQSVLQTGATMYISSATVQNSLYAASACINCRDQNMFGGVGTSAFQVFDNGNGSIGYISTRTATIQELIGFTTPSSVGGELFLTSFGTNGDSGNSNPALSGESTVHAKNTLYLGGHDPTGSYMPYFIKMSSLAIQVVGNVTFSSGATVSGSSLTVSTYILDQGSMSVTGAGGASVTYGATLGSATVSNLAASLPVQTDANKQLISGLISVSTAVTGTLQAAQEPAHTGDVTNSAGSLAMTLASVVTANQFGSATVVPVITFDAKGRLTAVSSATISASGGGGIVSPATFTWVNNFGIQVSTLQSINSTGPTSLVVSTAATGISQLAVSSAIAVNPTDAILSVSSTSGTTILWIDNAGNLISSGTTTTVTSCGTSPSVAGNNIAGQITVGGGVVTACTLNFANTGFVNAPICVFSDNSTTVTPSLGATSGSSVVINLSATLGGGLINYLCTGYQK